MVNELANWNGWTIDLRLRQFRYVDKDKPSMEIVEFDSKEGHDLFHEYAVEMQEYHDQSARDYTAIQLDIENDSFCEEDCDILANEMFHGAHGEKG